MKILHVITTINRGGAENHIFDLIRSHVGSGLSVTVAYLKGDGYWTPSLRELGVRVEPLGLKQYGDLAPLMRLRTLINDVAPDIIHAHMPPAELYSRISLLFLGKKTKLVITKHNDEPFFRGIGHRAVGRWVARRATHLITVSDSVNAYMRTHLNIFPDTLTTIHHGIDTSPYEKISPELCQELRFQWKVPSRAHVIGTVARFVPQKSLHVLLKAYALYRISAQIDSRLILVGSGPLENELRALASELSLDDAIVWAGFREDIPVVMNTFDIFALTSSYEGFGLVLLEAMAAARPVIASRLSAIPEIIDHDVTGILCAPGDHKAFAEAFTLMENNQLRACMGEAGRQRVKSNFTISQMSSQTREVYDQCVREC